VGSHPWGKPEDRALDIRRGIEHALARPESNRVVVRRPRSGLELRRCIAAQFVIVYAYLKGTDRCQRGVVSIRAVRHVRVRDVFAGVQEPRQLYQSAGSSSLAQGILELRRQGLEKERLFRRHARLDTVPAQRISYHWADGRDDRVGKRLQDDFRGSNGE
jgi:hypothetical protein